MSQINSLRAYTDCKELFDAAMADPKGARAQVGDQGAAMNMRTRLHYFRRLDREANEKIYPVDNPMHGTSIYDTFVVRMYMDTEDQWWIYVEPRGTGLVIEGLSDTPEVMENGQ